MREKLLSRKIEAVANVEPKVRELLREIVAEHSSAQPEEVGLPKRWPNQVWGGKDEGRYVPSEITFKPRPEPELAPPLPQVAPATVTIIEADGWAIGTDGVQWILRRFRSNRWFDLSFVRSTKRSVGASTN